MPSGAPDLSWFLCYQLQLSGGFSIQFQLWEQCLLLGDFFGVTEKFKPFSGKSFSWGDNVLVERFYDMISTESTNIIHIISLLTV